MFLKGSENIVKSRADYHRDKHAKAEATYRREQLEQSEAEWPRAEAASLRLRQWVEKMERLFYNLRQDFESQGLDFMSGPDALYLFMEASGGNVDVYGPIEEWDRKYGWLHEKPEDLERPEELLDV